MNIRSSAVYGLFLLLAFSLFVEIECKKDTSKVKVARVPARATIKKEQNSKVYKPKDSKPKVSLRQDAEEPSAEDEGETPPPPTDSQIGAGIRIAEGQETPSTMVHDDHVLKHPDTDEVQQAGDDSTNPDDEQTNDVEGEQEEDQDDQEVDNDNDQSQDEGSPPPPPPIMQPQQPQTQQQQQPQQQQQQQNCNPNPGNCNGNQMGAGGAVGVGAGMNRPCNNQQNCGGIPQNGMMGGAYPQQSGMNGGQMCNGMGGAGAGCNGMGAAVLGAMQGALASVPGGMDGMHGCNGAGAGGCMNGQMGGMGQYGSQGFGGMGGYYNHMQGDMGASMCPAYCRKRCTPSCPKACCKSKVIPNAVKTGASKKHPEWHGNRSLKQKNAN